ncbi:methyl-accepting chemotaxis protein [Pelagerythrobacter marinus]|uniref:methyl-accepting chemotaxis protein n=1 Tax=Pelagerythrobacter marinus TaxID=538382 RepID=UPI002036BB6B|nr:methyl-accepting chemotaxis protein [Pelagerythrobacter marinus]USA40073.1 methyl-accepting chemotaxis protein [Pelagerythrobacter marinus]WPZ05805.1 methyl-accepting chemotaxis protein [Pelagerythrobacter marinus]
MLKTPGLWASDTAVSRPSQLATALRGAWDRATATIAGRIRLFAMFFVALLVALGLVLGAVFYQLTASNHAASVYARGSLAASELTTAIAESRYHSARYAVTGAPEEIARARQTLANARQRLTETRDGAGDIGAEAIEAISWLDVQVDGFEAELDALESSIAAYGPSDSAVGLAAAIDVSGELLAGQAREVESTLARRTREAHARLADLNRTLTGAVIVLIAACVVAALLAARFLVRQVAGAIREFTASMSGLAAGDQTVPIPGTTRGDEIGEMARALVVFREDARELAALQEESARRSEEKLAARDRQAEVLRDLASRFERTVGEVVGGIAAASKQLEGAAGEMARSAEQAASHVDGVAGSMEEASRGVAMAAATGEQFAASIREIGEQAAGSAERARHSLGSVDAVDATTGELSQAATQIGEIVSLIDSIAEQTNILALNATIEASRAGQVGAGFAVVANEIKDLARRTRESTGEIAGQVSAVQQASTANIGALREIGEHVRNVEGNASAIARSVEEQGIASRDLAHSLDLAASGTDSIRVSLDRVRGMVRTTDRSAEQMLAAAGDLHRQAERLRAQVDDFLAYVRRA